MADEEHVAARGEGAGGAVRHLSPLGERLHVEVVRDRELGSYRTRERFAGPLARRFRAGEMTGKGVRAELDRAIAEAKGRWQS